METFNIYGGPGPAVFSTTDETLAIYTLNSLNNYSRNIAGLGKRYSLEVGERIAMNTFKVTFTYRNGNSDCAFCRSMEIAVRCVNRAYEVVGAEIVGVTIQFQ